ncbi:hypothetical protein MJO28_014532, partial [Puccinia striiformis f. sp. tritici]
LITPPNIFRSQQPYIQLFETLNNLPLEIFSSSIPNNIINRFPSTMQLYKSIGLVLLIATTVKTQRDASPSPEVTLPRVPKREDKFCTKGGAHYCFKKIARDGGLFAHIAVPTSPDQKTNDTTCNKLRSGFKATQSCCDYQQFDQFPDKQNKDKDIFVVTNKGFETACPQDIGRNMP